LTRSHLRCLGVGETSWLSELFRGPEKGAFHNRVEEGPGVRRRGRKIKGRAEHANAIARAAEKNWKWGSALVKEKGNGKSRNSGWGLGAS